MLLQPLSKSTYTNFLRCPWKAHAHKNLGIPSISGPAAIFGVKTHELIAAVLLGQVKFDEIDIYAESDEMAEMTRFAVSYLTAFVGPDLFVEQYALVGPNGKLIDMESMAMSHGYLDALFRESAARARFWDWKTGRFEAWNEMESHLYALAARAFFPGITEVVAELVFLRSGNVLQTTYQWEDDNTICLVTKPDGSQHQLWSETDPILEYVLVRIDEILATKPEPRPGSHCRNWYGQPCQFFNKECPLFSRPDMERNLPEIVVNPSYAQALASVLRGEEIDESLASKGLFAVEQMEEFLAHAKDRIKDWSRKNGPITVGKTKYGWSRTVESEVDLPFVINTLMEFDVPLEDWGKILSVSKTSIKHLPKREYPEVRSLLDSFAITPKPGKPKFGEIKKEKKNG